MLKNRTYLTRYLQAIDNTISDIDEHAKDKNITFDQAAKQTIESQWGDPESYKNGILFDYLGVDLTSNPKSTSRDDCCTTFGCVIEIREKYWESLVINAGLINRKEEIVVFQELTNAIQEDKDLPEPFIDYLKTQTLTPENVRTLLMPFAQYQATFDEWVDNYIKENSPE